MLSLLPFDSIKVKYTQECINGTFEKIPSRGVAFVTMSDGGIYKIAFKRDGSNDLIGYRFFYQNNLPEDLLNVALQIECFIKDDIRHRYSNFLSGEEKEARDIREYVLQPGEDGKRFRRDLEWIILDNERNMNKEFYGVRKIKKDKD